MDYNVMTKSNTKNVNVKERKGISGSTLKLVAIITMLIDHTAAVILEKILVIGEANGTMTSDSYLYIIYVLMRMIGRLAFPIFCFLLVQGFLHTRNVKKYALRLAAFAIISEIPFDLALFGKINNGYQNVFFTLFIGLLVMVGFKSIQDKWADKKWLPVLAVFGAVAVGFACIVITVGLYSGIYGAAHDNAYNAPLTLDRLTVYATCGFTAISLLVFILIARIRSLQKASISFADFGILVAGIALANILYTDYSGFGVLTIAVMYGLRSNSFKSMLGGCVTLTVMSGNEVTCFIDLVLIRFYNGKRGLNLKYFFYAFYPVHLYILYLICRMLKIVY